MKLKIANDEQLNEWLNERIRMGRDVFSIKGAPPKGAAYDDGEIIDSDINIAWRDGTSGEVFTIKYEVPA